jgi:hypothetical protein
MTPASRLSYYHSFCRPSQNCGRNQTQGACINTFPLDAIKYPTSVLLVLWHTYLPAIPCALLTVGVRDQALQPTGKPNPQWLPRGLQPPYVPVPFLNPPPVHWW